MFSENFKKDLEECIGKKNDYHNLTVNLCRELEENSPSNYTYYYVNGFFSVEVSFEDIDDYVRFFDDLVDCKYTSVRSLNGVILMVSLSVLGDMIL